jgi:hypothetical protein
MKYMSLHGKKNKNGLRAYLFGSSTMVKCNYGRLQSPLQTFTNGIFQSPLQIFTNGILQSPFQALTNMLLKKTHSKSQTLAKINEISEE